MADYAVEGSIGTRIAAARRARGFRTTKELAMALQGTGVTTAVLENLESGRRVGIDVSQLLNIAFALKVPVSALLVPISRPSDAIDIPNLSSGLASMSAGDFDAWFAGIPSAGYRTSHPDERADRGRLNALRELETARRGLVRLQAAAGLEDESSAKTPTATRGRIDATRAVIAELEQYLRACGWEV